MQRNKSELNKKLVTLARLRTCIVDVKQALDDGADIDFRYMDNGYNGAAALHAASQFGHTDIVRLLLARKANPNLLDANGFSALYMATQYGYRETIEALIDNGADPYLFINRNGEKYIPLDAALDQGHLDIAALLLRYMAKTNIDKFSALFQKIRRMERKYSHSLMHHFLYELADHPNHFAKIKLALDQEMKGTFGGVSSYGAALKKNLLNLITSIEESDLRQPYLHLAMSLNSDHALGFVFAYQFKSKELPIEKGGFKELIALSNPNLKPYQDVQKALEEAISTKDKSIVPALLQELVEIYLVLPAAVIKTHLAALDKKHGLKLLSQLETTLLELARPVAVAPSFTSSAQPLRVLPPPSRDMRQTLQQALTEALDSNDEDMIKVCLADIEALDTAPPAYTPPPATFFQAPSNAYQPAAAPPPYSSVAPLYANLSPTAPTPYAPPASPTPPVTNFYDVDWSQLPSTHSRGTHPQLEAFLSLAPTGDLIRFDEPIAPVSPHIQHSLLAAPPKNGPLAEQIYKKDSVVMPYDSPPAPKK